MNFSQWTNNIYRSIYNLPNYLYLSDWLSNCSVRWTYWREY